MSDDPNNVQEYRRLVLEYEALDEQIDALLEANGGHSENMSDAERQQYHALAEQRNALYNQIKMIEAMWDEDDTL